MIEILKELHGLGWPGAVVLSVFLIVAAALIAIAMQQFCDRSEDSAEQCEPIEPVKEKIPQRGTKEYWEYIENYLKAERVDNDRQWRMLRQLNNVPTSPPPPLKK